MKTIKPYLIVTILVLLAIIMISDKLIFWGIGVLAAALIILGIQQLTKLNVKVSLFEDNIKNPDEKNNSLQTQNKKLLEWDFFEIYEYRE
jgi:hypothetical protein